MTPDLLTVSGLSKSFGPSVRALLDVEFTLRAGEVHALVGENGAGKSTLSRILAGIETPDAGGIVRLGGEPYAPANRADAERRGVRMMMQELNLIPTLTVAESIFVDRLPHRFGIIDYRRLNAEARAVMAEVGLEQVDPSRPIGSLGIGQQQMVEIAAALSRPCSLLILDEPTAALTAPEIALLFRRIERLKEQGGVGIIYISHRMEELRRIADRVSVLRDGRRVATFETGATTDAEIIHHMVGRELPERRPPTAKPRPGADTAAALRVADLCRGAAVRNVSFTLRQGEILGFAGLMGSGRTETLRALYGADPADSGTIYRGETPVRIRSPRDAVRAGIALLTEDRKQQGLLLPLSIRANITLPRLENVTGTGGWISAGREAAVAGRQSAALGVRCASVEQPVGDLSGGNQQKVVLAKWLYRDCDVLLFDEPTRGIDVGAKFEIYRLLTDLAQAGKAILVVSSDLLELIGLCDRIAVLSAGAIAAFFERNEFAQDRIMTAALSGYTGKPVLQP